MVDEDHIREIASDIEKMISDRNLSIVDVIYYLLRYSPNLVGTQSKKQEIDNAIRKIIDLAKENVAKNKGRNRIVSTEERNETMDDKDQIIAELKKQLSEANTKTEELEELLISRWDKFREDFINNASQVTSIEEIHTESIKALQRIKAPKKEIQEIERLHKLSLATRNRNGN